MTWAKVIEDSRDIFGNRLTTLQLRYPRIIHAELLTHRVFSRNASSSRAIPVAKMLADIEADPYVPMVFGKNGKGMQAHGDLPASAQLAARDEWLAGMREAVARAKALVDIGVHKQHANRLTEPYSWIDVVLTASKFENFLALRDHTAAQPEIQKLAQDMKLALSGSSPILCGPDRWHLPYVTQAERASLELPLQLQCSVARCARVSYRLHDGTATDPDKDAERYYALLNEKHFSPFEHQAHPADGPANLGGNFGPAWVQYRKTLSGEYACEA